MIPPQGFWKNKYSVDNAGLEQLPATLVRRGQMVVEVEYRRRDHPGGGWPGTNNDVLAALQSIPAAAARTGQRPDLSRVTVIGHSAGGTLVLP